MSETAFESPTMVSDVELAFGGDMRKLLPAYESIPEDFRRERGVAVKWVALQRRWFFKGLPKDTEFVTKDGIDAKAALRHLGAIQGSFDPKHEHKQAGIAYLMSLWFDDIKAPPEAR